MKLWKCALALTLCLCLTACGNAPAESVESPAPAGTEKPNAVIVAQRSGREARQTG